MTYFENIFVCVAAPLLVTAICLGRKYYKSFLFCLAGMAACLVSAYVNSFLTRLYGVGILTATIEITPVVEEIIKLLPLLFYLLVFEPREKDIHSAVILIAAAFATFENICYLTQNGAAELNFLLIRGFGTGAMHIVCGAIVGYGLVYLWPKKHLKLAGTVGLLAAAISFHAIYNLLLSAQGVAQWIAYGLPLCTVLIGVLIGRLRQKTIP